MRSSVVRVCLSFAALSMIACGDDSATDGGADVNVVDSTTQDASAQDSSTQDSGATDATSDAAEDASLDAATDGGATDAATDGGLGVLCTSTGGTVSTALCCKNTTDFPSTCTTGACGCSPQNSHNVQSCQCPTNKCFTQQLGCH